MDDLKFEEFTVTGAVDAGLIESIRRGECSVTGKYSLEVDGYLKFEQNSFIFEDKSGRIRIGRFADTYQLMEFCKQFSKLHGVVNVDGINFIANEIEEK